MTALPPGPSEPPVVQTLRWLLRPISFLESCRRRFGDAFSITFLGFQSPMVMLSDPEAIRALYTVPGHTLPPGRTLALQPIMGSRSCCCSRAASISRAAS
jgi:cytochrome P450